MNGQWPKWNEMLSNFVNIDEELYNTTSETRDDLESENEYTHVEGGGTNLKMLKNVEIAMMHVMDSC